MLFDLNGVCWVILEVPQEKFYKENEEQGDGYIFGETHYDTREVWLDEDSHNDVKRKTLMHELMHVYLKSFVTYQDMTYTEEMVCDICSNSHDIINDIVSVYFDDGE